ncbi:MAG: xanthine dehydrogenase family protein molybdopterin-binding subunit [Thermoleophilia bacterium]|nr:xanthine dehydrogenase family protein molybdopterin-binding subunit [Thermoleophilia bacterium]
MRAGTPAIVTGEARYSGDCRKEGMLFARVARSPHSRALITAVSASEALALPGAAAVLIASDIPGENLIGMTGKKHQPVMAETDTRFMGEAVAVVAAETRAVAMEAARSVRVEYEPLPAVHSVEESMAPEAPRLGPEGNVAWQGRVTRGDFERAAREADVVLTGVYRTPPVDHAYIETESVLAEPEVGGMRVWSSSKNVHLDQREIARVLGWPKERIRVTAPTIGGNFGGKPDLPQLCMAALLCERTGRPVLLEMSREESLQVSTKRHPVVFHMTHCADRRGRLLGVKMEAYADAGAYLDYTVPVMQRIVIHGAGPYRVENVLLEGWGYYTNNPLSGAMRGFGVPQVTFACERQMDRLADALGLDPIDIRIMNALQTGDRTATGQVLESPVGLGEALNKARELIPAEEWTGSQEDTSHTGWGVACFHYGNGLTAMPNRGTAVVRLLEGGRIQLAIGSPDVGQGSNLALGQLAAEALGLEVSHVEVLSADTSLTPDSGSSSGTRVTYVVGNAVVSAARSFGEELAQRAAAVLGTDRAALSLELSAGRPVLRSDNFEFGLAELYEELGDQERPLEVTGTFDPPTTSLDPATGQGAPYGAYTFGVQLAKVSVDHYTGKVGVERIVSLLDVGTVVNPLLLRGQVEGGCAMGIGYALLEEIELQGGRVVNDNFDRYLLPTAVDVCDVTLVIIGAADSTGPYGAKGIGEPATIPTAAAIANAVSRAAQIDVRQLPLSLERVSAALAEREEGGFR